MRWPCASRSAGKWQAHPRTCGAPWQRRGKEAATGNGKVATAAARAADALRTMGHKRAPCGTLCGQHIGGKWAEDSQRATCRGAGGRRGDFKEVTTSVTGRKHTHYSDIACIPARTCDSKCHAIAADADGGEHSDTGACCCGKDWLRLLVRCMPLTSFAHFAAVRRILPQRRLRTTYHLLELWE